MSRGNGARAIALLGALVVALMLALSWIVRTDSLAAGSFHLDEIALCEDIDENMGPAERLSEFAQDVKQVCLWFEYSRGRDGDELDVMWSREDEDIQRESFKLLHPRGTRAFYLMMEDGSSLPSGSYSVTILCNGRIKGIERFSIAGSSVMPDGGDEADGGASDDPDA